MGAETCHCCIPRSICYDEPERVAALEMERPGGMHYVHLYLLAYKSCMRMVFLRNCIPFLWINLRSIWVAMPVNKPVRQFPTTFITFLVVPVLRSVYP